MLLPDHPRGCECHECFIGRAMDWAARPLFEAMEKMMDETTPPKPEKPARAHPEDKPVEERIAEFTHGAMNSPSLRLLNEAETELRKLRRLELGVPMLESISKNLREERDKLRAQLAEAVDVAKKGLVLHERACAVDGDDSNCKRCHILARLSALAKESGVGFARLSALAKESGVG